MSNCNGRAERSTGYESQRRRFAIAGNARVFPVAVEVRAPEQHA